MPRIQVGLPSLQGDVAKYASKFDMVELRFEPGSIPRPSTLRSWRKATNPSFTFSVVLPRIVGELADTKPMRAALDDALSAATLVEARCIVLATAPDVRPTATTRDRLRVIVDRLPRPGVVLCWEPHGLWDTGELTSTARALGLLPVIDATRDPLPLGPMAYTRIRALGAAQAVSARALDRLAEQLKGRREAWVVVEDRTSCQRIKAQLGQAMDRLGPTSAPIVVRPSPGKMRAEDEEQ